jgi:AcrR family transcriptional regulator
MKETRTRDEVEPPGDDAVGRIIISEVGEELGELLNEARRNQEAVDGERHQDEGLRERKRRLTRQRISDVATTLFSMRGFDNVTVAEIAEIVGVSEKTIYNYFPTKESLILDEADATVRRFAEAFRESPPGESPTRIVLGVLDEEARRFLVIPDDLLHFFPNFVELVQSTPPLRAAWLDIRNQMTAIVRDELAARAEVDPNDPEPQIAARALVGLADIGFESRVRHIKAGLRGKELNAAVRVELERAARLIETGLWSFDLLTQGRRTREQMTEAARSADESRAQVLKALRQARAGWRKIREQR